MTIIYSYIILISTLFIGCNKPVSKKNINERSNDQETINKTDENGLKQGKWIDTTQRSLIHKNYLNDKLDGEYIELWKPSKLTKVSGQYKDDEKVGTWKYYSKGGKLTFELTQIARNDSIVIKRYSSRYKPKMISYVKVYDHQEGYLHSEGYLLYEESFDGDESIEYGTWKYYDKDGNLLREEEK